jgi:EpsI family protein
LIARAVEPVRAPRAEIVVAIVLCAASVFAHRAPLAAMVRQWSVSPMYSYGFMVPIVAAFLAWSRRDVLRTLSPRPSRGLAALVLLGGMGLLAIGKAGGLQVLEQLAFLVSLVGIVLLLFGLAYVRASWAALAYLLLMVPLWDGFTESLHWPFQQRSAGIGVAILHAVGIPAHREGTFIELPGLTLEVARACSGINYLVAVLALGLPLSYVYLRGFWRRAVLIVSAVTIAALSNGLRVALIGVLAHFEIGSPLHGPFHVLHGLFVSGIGFVVLFAGLRWLEQPRPDADLDRARGGGPAKATPTSGFSVRLPRAEALACLLVFIGFGSGVLAGEPRPVPLTAGLDSFPSTLGTWQASPFGGPKSWPRDLWRGADAELRRSYRSNGRAIDVYIAYFETQSQSKEVAGSRTLDLHRRAERVRVADSRGAEFDANLVRASSEKVAGQDPRDVFFWYEMNDAVELSASGAKIRTIWNALAQGRTNGAVVALSTPARSNNPTAGEDDRARARDLSELAALVHEALGPHLPGRAH